uniref:Uncharacterized protein n=2 Tax=Anguilla anguilla TaxID=7936 RepID=A0A0E9Q1N1_ANGAN
MAVRFRMALCAFTRWQRFGCALTDVCVCDTGNGSSLLSFLNSIKGRVLTFVWMVMREYTVLYCTGYLSHACLTPLGERCGSSGSAPTPT